MGNNVSVDVVVKAVAEGFDKVSSEVAKIGKSGETAKAGISNFSNSMTELNSAVNLAMTAFNSFSGAAQQIYSLGKEGAQLEFTASKFDRLSKSVGTTSDTLMTKLRSATKGLMSDTQLMASASDLMTLGLAKSEAEVVRLTNVAGQLGMNMNQLVMTLTNQTTMRFDALGVSVDGFDAKLKSLKDSGMDTNAAFTEAFLQQAEAQLGKVGSVADSDAAAFMRLEAATQDIAAEFKRSLAPAVVAVIEPLTIMISANRKLADAINANDDAVKNTTGTYEEYLAEKERELNLAGLILVKTEDGNRVMKATGNGLVDVTDKYEIATRAGYKLAKATQDMSKDFSDVGVSARRAADGMSGIEEAAADAEAAYQKMQDTIAARREMTIDFAISGDFGDAWGDYKESLTELETQHGKLITDLDTIKNQGYGETTAKVRDLNEAIKENEDKQISLAEKMQLASKEMLFQQLAAGLDAEASYELAFQMGLVDKASLDAATQMAALKEQYDQGIITLPEYIELAKELADRINNINSKSVTITARFVTTGDIDNPFRNTLVSSGNSNVKNVPSVGGYAGRGYASGADFVVPPGFPNDTYPLRAESGERVNITPAGQQSGDTALLQQILSAVSRGNSLNAKDIGSEVVRGLVKAGVVG